MALCYVLGPSVIINSCKFHQKQMKGSIKNRVGTKSLRRLLATMYALTSYLPHYVFLQIATLLIKVTKCDFSP